MDTRLNTFPWQSVKHFALKLGASAVNRHIEFSPGNKNVVTP